MYVQRFQAHRMQPSANTHSAPQVTNDIFSFWGKG
uniref:Uncharacterized protein n=1 Tax=Rhizophora mucronata TaxID=61149 RepID=A0A2P2NUK8_RHIMU